MISEHGTMMGKERLSQKNSSLKVLGMPQVSPQVADPAEPLTPGMGTRWGSGDRAASQPQEHRQETLLSRATAYHHHQQWSPIPQAIGISFRTHFPSIPTAQIQRWPVIILAFTIRVEN